MAKQKKDEVPIDRRAPKDRRGGTDRREQDVPVASDRRRTVRRKVPRRRQIDPTTCERDYTSEELEFMQALDAYKRANGRMFPTCSEILEVIRDMGYVRMPKDDEIQTLSSATEAPMVAATDEDGMTNATATSDA